MLLPSSSSVFHKWKKSALQTGIFSVSECISLELKRIFRQRRSVDTTKPSSPTHSQKRKQKANWQQQYTKHCLESQGECEDLLVFGILPWRGKFNEWGRGWSLDVAVFSKNFNQSPLLHFYLNKSQLDQISIQCSSITHSQWFKDRKNTIWL